MASNKKQDKEKKVSASKKSEKIRLPYEFRRTTNENANIKKLFSNSKSKNDTLIHKNAKQNNVEKPILSNVPEQNDFEKSEKIQLPHDFRRINNENANFKNLFSNSTIKNDTLINKNAKRNSIEKPILSNLTEQNDDLFKKVKQCDVNEIKKSKTIEKSKKQKVINETNRKKGENNKISQETDPMIDKNMYFYKNRSFARRHVGSDGNCLFRCLAVHVSEDEAQYRILRETVVDFVCLNWNEYKESARAASVVNSYETESDYRKIMSVCEPVGEYGTEFEVAMFGRIFSLNIEVFTIQKKNLLKFEGFYDFNSRKKEADLILLFTGSRRGGHWTVLYEKFSKDTTDLKTSNDFYDNKSSPSK